MPQRTVLHDRERALGASFAEFFGFELPAHFGDPVAEHRAVRAAAGLFDFAYRGFVEVSGPHRVRFLDGQVTAALKGLVDGQGAYAATLTPTGKMVADLRVYVVGETFLLDTPPAAARAVIEHLAHFRVADRVTFVDVTDRLGALLVQGPASAAVAEAALGAPLPPPVPYANLTRRVETLADDRGPVEVRLCRCSLTGEEGFELLCPAPRLPALYDRLLEAGRPLGLVPAGQLAFESLRIEAGVPLFGVDMDSSTNPLEARLTHAISFQKGCYTGQEVIAKATYIGQVNRLLVGLEFPEGVAGLAPGDPLVAADKETGRITSLAYAPTLERPVGLGMVRREAAEPGTRLTAASRGAPAVRRPAVVAALPFVSRPRA
ncbi:MAG TPA: aminomethyltransferase family protein [Thermodesulfobacteriota bacterium]|nr:aminomethyltransferase family protein [Thermodesulfobacteriota bacterium]